MNSYNNSFQERTNEKNLSVRQPICISMRCTGNNTIRTAWNPVTRKRLKTISAGRMGLKGARRGSPYAAEMAGRELGMFLLGTTKAGPENANTLRGSKTVSAMVSSTPSVGRETAYESNKVAVLFSGHSSVIGSGLRGLRLSGLKVVSITDVTPQPHNGCRARKPRRV